MNTFPVFQLVEGVGSRREAQLRARSAAGVLPVDGGAVPGATVLAVPDRDSEDDRDLARHRRRIRHPRITG